MSSVSVVIPARNAAKTIKIAVNSILSSTCVGEVIVIDDGSTDETAHIVGGIIQQKVILVPGSQSGISDALNIGFSLAKYPYVARCDADDWYPEDRLERQVEWLDAHVDFVAVCGGFTTVTERGRPIAALAMSGKECEITEELVHGNARTSFCTWLTRKEVINRVGGARRWFETGEDIDLQFRLAEEGSVWFQPKNNYFYRLHDASTVHTQANARREFFEEHCTIFALQRRARGSDDLNRGKSPKPPTEPCATAHSARAHAIGLFIGQIWLAFDRGDTLDALRHVGRALREFPNSLIIWRTVFVMLLKRFFRRR